jgi:hypothetical protein
MFGVGCGNAENKQADSQYAEAVVLSAKTETGGD